MATKTGDKMNKQEKKQIEYAIKSIKNEDELMRRCKHLLIADGFTIDEIMEMDKNEIKEQLLLLAQKEIKSNA